MNHWHVTRSSDDDMPFVTTDLFAAIDYAATEIRDMAEFEHEGIRISGEQGDYEQAYKFWDSSEKYDAVYQNAHHVVHQHDLDVKDRAPIYTNPETSDTMLWELATRRVDEINSDSPVAIWMCSMDTDNPETWCYQATHDEEGDLLTGYAGDENEGEPDTTTGADARRYCPNSPDHLHSPDERSDCDECGAAIPDSESSEDNAAHADSCSLYTGNTVQAAASRHLHSL